MQLQVRRDKSPPKPLVLTTTVPCPSVEGALDSGKRAQSGCFLAVPGAGGSGHRDLSLASGMLLLGLNQQTGFRILPQSPQCFLSKGWLYRRESQELVIVQAAHH